MASKKDEVLAAWSEFFVSHALCLREVERDIARKAPLSLDEYDLLLVISRNPDQRIRLSALAEATNYTKSGISRIVRRMEKNGHLRKQECPRDRRGSYAAITDQGKRALFETWRWYSEAILSIFDPCFSQQEVAILGGLLSRLAQTIRDQVLLKIGEAEA